ncbi:hypothetical protein ACIQCD_18555 [Streptomyces sp. NPDC093250]|uniref:hypothetical protein n=1 Tax=Streptomyces sp. NPDC093250 TaxID=3366036 RepID=UPI00382DEA7E
MSTDNGRVPRHLLLSAPTRCPDDECDGGAESLPPARLVNRTDNRERAILMRAFSEGNTGLTDDQPGLGTRCAAVVRSALHVEGRISAIARFRCTQAVPEPPGSTEGEISRATTDTAAPAPGQAAFLWRLLLWPVTLASAAFDSAFVASVVQQLLNAQPDSVHYWMAYLPGIGMAVCLLAAGSALAARTARPPHKPGKAARPGRRLGALACRWGFPGLFTALVLGLIGTCGFVRVTMAVNTQSDPVLEQYQWVMVALLLLLSIASVVAKYLSHDPTAVAYPEHRKAAKALARRGRTAERLADEARKALTLHVTAWFTLKAEVDAARQRALRHVEDASTSLVEERARTGQAGPFDFPLESSSWPPEHRSAKPCALPLEALTAAPDRREPEVRIILLDEAQSILADHHHNALTRRVREAIESLDQLWGPDAPPTKHEDNAQLGEAPTSEKDLSA